MWLGVLPQTLHSRGHIIDPMGLRNARDRGVTVYLVGGPCCWDGVVIEDVYDHWEIYEVPISEVGALLSVPGQVSPRAVYEPKPGADRSIWHFEGWETATKGERS